MPPTAGAPYHYRAPKESSAPDSDLCSSFVFVQMPEAVPLSESPNSSDSEGMMFATKHSEDTSKGLNTVSFALIMDFSNSSSC